MHQRHDVNEEGFTLVELLVAMSIFAIVLALISSSVLVMEHALRKSQGQSDNLDASRKVIQLLDRQVRYANAITQPGVGATATSTYIEWRTGDTSGEGVQTQTCTQWRFDGAAGTLGYRTWAVPAKKSDPTTATAWVNEAFGVVAVAGTPVFSTTAQPAATASPTATPAGSPSGDPSDSLGHAEISFSFAIKHGGNPSTTSRSQVSLAAVNTSGIATGQAVCGQEGRP